MLGGWRLGMLELAPCKHEMLPKGSRPLARVGRVLGTSALRKQPEMLPKRGPPLARAGSVLGTSDPCKHHKKLSQNTAHPWQGWVSVWEQVGRANITKPSRNGAYAWQAWALPGERARNASITQSPFERNITKH